MLPAFHFKNLFAPGQAVGPAPAVDLRQFKLGPIAGLLIFFAALFQADGASAQFFNDPTFKLYSIRETVAKLLPDAQVLTRRDVVLTPRQLRWLRKNKNWDSDTTEFTFYHAKNKARKITRTLVIFPENTRHGPMVMAVALSNRGRVLDVLLTDIQNKTMDWVLPLVRAGYLKTFAGKDRNLKLKLPKKFKSSTFPPISQTYALLIANAVKKSAQLFHVVLQEKQ
ncbi:MAG: hypothetical protein ACE5G9_12735 [Nitrospinales bacterium]